MQFKGIGKDTDFRKIVIYTRVSTRNQSDDLENQVDFLQTYANAKGLIADEIIRDYGSGLNYNRKKWNQLLVEVMENKIKMILVWLRKYKKQIERDETVAKGIQDRNSAD